MGGERGKTKIEVKSQGRKSWGGKRKKLRKFVDRKLA